MISFTAILWNLSGTLTLPIVRGRRAQGDVLDRLLLYVLFASIIAFWIGRPIIWLSFNNEKFNAAFRYALVRLRDASEAVAFYRGEVAERTAAAATLRAGRSQLQALHQPDDRFLRLESLDESDHRAAALSVAVPAVLRRADQARRHHPVRVGVQQHPAGAVVLPQRVRQFAGYRAAIIRLHGLVVANEEGRALPQVDAPRHVSTARSSSTTSRSARPTASSSSTRWTCAWKSATRWSSPARRAAARPRCCAALPSCGRSPPAR